MLTVSLWLMGAALTLAAVALTIAFVLDRRDQDQRVRQRGQRTDPLSLGERPTVVEWGRTFVLASDDLPSPQARPDVVIGPWTSSGVRIKDEPRKAA